MKKINNFIIEDSYLFDKVSSIIKIMGVYFPYISINKEETQCLFEIFKEIKENKIVRFEKDRLFLLNIAFNDIDEAISLIDCQKPSDFYSYIEMKEDYHLSLRG